MKKVVLFGGSGLIGSEIQNLLSHSYSIIAPSHQEVDVTNKDTIMNCIRSIKPDSIIYSAAVSNPDIAEKNQTYAMDINATAPLIISEVAKKYGSSLIYLSSDAVFRGDKKNQPYDEEDKTDPINFYGFTKQKGEEHVLGISSSNCVMRLITVYSHYYPRKLDIARLAIKAFMNKDPFTGIIDQYMNFTYINDAVYAVSRIIDKKISGIIHVGSEDFMSNYDFINTLADISGFGDISIQAITLAEFNINKKAKRGNFIWLRTKKAQRLLGEDIIVPIKSGLIRFWQNFRI